MEGILNVHLWNSDNWDIKTEEEQFGEPEQEEGIWKTGNKENTSSLRCQPRHTKSRMGWSDWDAGSRNI